MQFTNSLNCGFQINENASQRVYLFCDNPYTPINSPQNLWLITIHLYSCLQSNMGSREDTLISQWDQLRFITARDDCMHMNSLISGPMPCCPVQIFINLLHYTVKSKIRKRSAHLILSRGLWYTSKHKSVLLHTLQPASDLCLFTESSRSHRNIDTTARVVWVVPCVRVNRSTTPVR